MTIYSQKLCHSHYFGKVLLIVSRPGSARDARCGNADIGGGRNIGGEDKVGLVCRQRKGGAVPCFPRYG